MRLLHLPLITLVLLGPHREVCGQGETPLPGERSPATAPIRVLQQEMAAGHWSAEQLTAHFLGVIAERNPELGAVISLNPQALDQARRLDEERSRGELRGPLHGIPLLVKDNIETRELPTTAGSLALAANRSGRDAPIVERLRQAGAVILGKTNLSEWANFRSTRSSSGWSAVGGQTRNPHDLSRSPCGSSSGSGSAVAAGLCVAALGTETDGSIVCPASSCGVTGLKPTLGLLSRSGIVPLAHSQDTAGPMTRCVEDAALLLQAMAGSDSRDPSTAAPCGTEDRPDLSHTVKPVSLEGLRIGVLRSGTGYHDGVEACFAETLGRLERAGAILVDNLELPASGEFDQDEYTVLLHEFKAGLDAYLAACEPGLPVGSLEELIRFNTEHASREMPWFGQEILESAQATTGLEAEDYRAATARLRRITTERGIGALLDSLELDLLVTPTGGPAWLIDLVNGDHFLGGFSSMAAIEGSPHLSLPMGRVHGLPVGLSLLARRCGDAHLLAAGEAIQALLKEQP